MGEVMVLWVGWWMGLSFDILIFDCLLKAPQPVTGLFFLHNILSFFPLVGEKKVHYLLYSGRNVMFPEINLMKLYLNEFWKVSKWKGFSSWVLWRQSGAFCWNECVDVNRKHQVWVIFELENSDLFPNAVVNKSSFMIFALASTRVGFNSRYWLHYQWLYRPFVLNLKVS